MFTTSLENNVTHVNDRNEYHVAEGISATVFRAILVSTCKKYLKCSSSLLISARGELW